MKNSVPLVNYINSLESNEVNMFLKFWNQSKPLTKELAEKLLKLGVIVKMDGGYKRIKNSITDIEIGRIVEDFTYRYNFEDNSVRNIRLQEKGR